MNTTDKLKELISRCDCGVYLEVNQHRDMYETLEDTIKLLLEDDPELNIAEDVQKKMVELDTIVRIQFYPNTPVGFYEIYHYDLDSALDEALSCADLKEKRSDD